MRVFERMRALRAFENQHHLFLRTGGNHHLIGEIGHHQATGKPLTLKQLFLLDVGSVATVQRRLRRLKELGLVLHRRSEKDRRSVELTLSLKCIRIFSKYDGLMDANPPAPAAAQGIAAARHICGFCDSDAGRRNLLVTFLAQALKRGDRCILVAPAESHDQIIAALPHRRRASEQMVVTAGQDSVGAQMAFFKRELRVAKQAGQATCVAADMAWTFRKNVRIEAILDIENRIDAVAERLPLTALCIYDARQFSSEAVLQAVKCHRDHARHPLMLG